MLNKHPKIDPFDQLQLLKGAAAKLGYRMPAEWEPLDAIWVVPPHNAETWPGCLDKAQAQHATWCERMRPYVNVRTTDELGIPTNDSWIRDFGPLFVKHKQSGKLALHDFFFNSWGDKYEGAAGRSHDNVVPQHMARELDLPLWVHNFVLEGGSIEVNGAGLLMSTEQCLFSGSRNPWLSRGQIEHALFAAFDLERIIWLPGGIAGDDTDGHIDDIARFVAEDRVVCVSAPEGHADHAMTQRNLDVLRVVPKVIGRGLEVIELPVPEPIMYDFPADSDHHAGGGLQPVPASYANFVFANDGLFVPVFGQTSDEIALRILDDACPGHTIVPVPAEHLVVGLGALHCLSMQQPA